MFLSWGADIGNAIADLFQMGVWYFTRTILTIIDAVQKAFFFLTGVEPLEISFNGTEVDMTLLEVLFGIKDGGKTFDFSQPIHKVFWGMFGVFLVVLIFCMICAAVKININREDKEALPSISKMLWKSVLAFGIELILPVIFCLLLAFAGLFMQTVIDVVKVGFFNVEGTTTIGNSIFKASIDGDKLNQLINDNSDGWNPDYTKLEWNMLKETYGKENVSLVILFLTSCCVVVGMVMCTITVAERLINIVLLYLIAPVVAATIPLDDGKRWESWKDITTSKIVTASANIISVYVFLYIIQTFGDIILNAAAEGNDKFVLTITYVLIAISGAFSCAKAGTLVASIISANQGQQEGMSFMASQAMLGMAGRLAGAALGGIAGATGVKSLFDKLKGGGNTSGGSNGGNTSGGSNETGGLSDTGFNKSDSSPSDTFNLSRNGSVNSVPSMNSGTQTAQLSSGNLAGGFSGPSGNPISNTMDAISKGTDKVLGTVGGAIKKAANLFTVPGMMKAIVSGVVAIPVLGGGFAKGVKKASTGGGRFLNEKLTGKKDKVDRNELGAAAKDKTVKQDINALEKSSKGVNLAKAKHEQHYEKPIAKLEEKRAKLEEQGAFNAANGKSNDKINKQIEKIDAKIDNKRESTGYQKSVDRVTSAENKSNEATAALMNSVANANKRIQNQEQRSIDQRNSFKERMRRGNGGGE